MSFPLFQNGKLLFRGGHPTACCCDDPGTPVVPPAPPDQPDPVERGSWIAFMLVGVWVTTLPAAWCRHRAWIMVMGWPSTRGPVVWVRKPAGISGLAARREASKTAAEVSLPYVHNSNFNCCDPADPLNCDDTCKGTNLWTDFLLQGVDNQNPRYHVSFSFEDCPVVEEGQTYPDGILTLTMRYLREEEVS